MMTAKAFDAVAAMGRTPFKATYQIWDTDRCQWQHCEFLLFASDKVAAERQAKSYCRDKKGQPIDFYGLIVRQLS